MGSYSAPPIPVAQFKGARRAELVFAGIEQAGPSFEGRVFLNHPDANEDTPQTPENGYAGSFHVYGYGQYPPPAMAEAKASRGPERTPVAPIEKRLHADEAAVRRALEDSDELTVTVVAIPVEAEAPVPDRSFEDVEVEFDRETTG